MSWQLLHGSMVMMPTLPQPEAPESLRGSHLPPMAQSIPEIYPKLREALEQFLHDRTKWNQIAAKLQNATPVELAEEDIVSMEDLAVAYAKPLFWGEHIQICGDFCCSCRSCQDTYLKKVAEDLLCLLKPVEEELLPPKGPTDQRIWEIFASAKKQHRQFGIMAVYAGLQVHLVRNLRDFPQPNQIFQISLSETNELVQSMQAQITGLLSSFRNVQLHLEGERLLSSELQTKMTKFAGRLKSYCGAFVTSMTTAAQWILTFHHEAILGAEYDPPPPQEQMDRHLKGQMQRWSRLAAEAAQIAAEVRKLKLPEVKSLGSWSLVSGSEIQVEKLEVGSMASGHSVDSQTSWLSGRGGPHCFLPSHVFSTFQSSVSAKDLQRGTKILAADGATVEVTKVEKQKTNKLLELEIDCAMPLTTTPHHRIMVPSDGEATTVMAVDLSPGNLVICSDCLPKKVLRKTEFLVEEQEVISVTFHPDKAVACFLPPDDPVVLTKGRTPKATRRGGMGSRGSKHDDEHPGHGSR